MKAILLALGLVVPHVTQAQPCAYFAQGDLIPRTGVGDTDNTVWAPDMVDPLGDHQGTTKTAYFGPGGEGGASGADQCDPRNFDNTNRDTYCEVRSGTDRDGCQRRDIHQGIDIHGGTPDTCRRMKDAEREIKNGGSPNLAKIVPIVAVQEGDISHIGSYSVDLRAGARKFRYLHMHKPTLQVREGDHVTKGQLVGYMWNNFGNDVTIFHLHLEISASVDGEWQHVSPYLSYIRAMERARSVTCSLTHD
jgi:peptidase M23-like protein